MCVLHRLPEDDPVPAVPGTSHTHKHKQPKHQLETFKAWAGASDSAVQASNLGHSDL
eukprot:SAG22_NODE_1257_length_4983_cov_2.902968_1_plen_57_part_00